MYKTGPDKQFGPSTRDDKHEESGKASGDLLSCWFGGERLSGRGVEGVEEDISNEPDDIENAQHPQTSHQLVRGGSPGDPTNQPPSVGPFDRAASLWSIVLLHPGERIGKGFVHSGG